MLQVWTVGVSNTEDFSDLFDDAPEPTPTPVAPTVGIGRKGRPRTRPIYPETRPSAPDPAELVPDETVRAFYQSPEGQRRMRVASTGRGLQVDEKEFYMPVGVSFLAKVLRLNQETVQRRLRTVTPVGNTGTSQNRPVYDFASVVPYLVKPKMDIRTYLRSLNPADMPVSISKVFWEAERIRNKTLLETGEAWRTEDVLEVMSQGNKMISDRIPLIVEGMRDEGLTDDQLAVLERLCDTFRNDVHSAFVEFPKQQSTPSRVSEVGMGIDED
jgi:Protein of unknown function (DUF1441)